MWYPRCPATWLDLHQSVTESHSSCNLQDIRYLSWSLFLPRVSGVLPGTFLSLGRVESLYRVLKSHLSFNPKVLWEMIKALVVIVISLICKSSLSVFISVRLYICPSVFKSQLSFEPYSNSIGQIWSLFSNDSKIIVFWVISHTLFCCSAPIPSHRQEKFY